MKPGPKPKDLMERLSGKFEVDPETGCWVWRGCKSKNGYGRVRIAGETRYVHRVVYELMVRPVGDGLELDHLCRNRACLNPDHLEEVTRLENIIRGVGPEMRRAMTHCKRGHEFNDENTVRYGKKQARKCRECIRILARAYKLKRRS